MRTAGVYIQGGKHRIWFSASVLRSAPDWRYKSSQTAGGPSSEYLRGHQISINKYIYLDLFSLVLNVSGCVPNFDDISYVVTGFSSGLERSNVDRDCIVC